jgi:hypothetical protein
MRRSVLVLLSLVSITTALVAQQGGADQATIARIRGEAITQASSETQPWKNNAIVLPHKEEGSAAAACWQGKFVGGQTSERVAGHN